MKKIGSILMLVVVSTGCAQQRLAMMDARIDPAKLSGGDETIISARVIDTQGVVAEVTATVREAPDIILVLKDSGEEPDKVAGDGVWSIAFDVPGGAPAGQYNWDFEAFKANGDPVKVTTADGGEGPLTAEASIEVTY
jgi:hypothetical protein